MLSHFSEVCTDKIYSQEWIFFAKGLGHTRSATTGGNTYYQRCKLCNDIIRKPKSQNTACLPQNYLSRYNKSNIVFHVLLSWS